MSGFWRIEPLAQTPNPALTAKAAADIAKVDRDGDTGKGANRWCVLQGMPHVMDSAGPIDVIQGGAEIVILTEILGVPRHIYIDGRKHPSEEVFDHTSLGNSVGAWRAGVLSVDTVGFSKGIGPFGAPRSEATHLAETFKVTGNRLVVTSTWTDRGVYSKPFTYTLVYDRMPADHTADNGYCDPRDHGAFLPGNLR